MMIDWPSTWRKVKGSGTNNPVAYSMSASLSLSAMSRMDSFPGEAVM